MTSGRLSVAIVGGGPAGLYLAILLRRADPLIAVRVYERNRIEDTFGFGVVLSDATEGILAEADRETHAAMAAAMHRWGDIDVHVGGTVITSGGTGAVASRAAGSHSPVHSRFATALYVPWSTMSPIRNPR